MKEAILQNLSNPQHLEQLYRKNKDQFRHDFNELYPVIEHELTARIWNQRLNFDEQTIVKSHKKDIFFVILAALIAGFIAKIPAFFHIDEDFFYRRNIPFIVFPFLITYFAWQQKIPKRDIITILTFLLLSLVYVNLLPINNTSSSIIIAFIHLPLFLWTLLGYTFIAGRKKDQSARMDYLRYNGDLLVMMAVLFLAGALLAGITVGLFSLIKVNIEEVFFEYIAIWELASLPIIATYLVHTKPQLVNKVSPIIAQIFTPAVLVTLVFYLIAVISTGKDPYNDREFLILFNLLLIGVLAIIFFSIAESGKNGISKYNTYLLFSLAIVTLIVNGIALSAIVYRIVEWGITPNRMAVLGSNVLIFIHLTLVTFRLIKSINNRNALLNVEKTITNYLPIYGAWTVIATFLFPLIFNFK